MRGILEEHVSRLDVAAAGASWLVTPEARDGDVSNCQRPVVYGDMVEYVSGEYVLTAAAGWHNARI